MITADQLIAHAVGDYILQSDWMAVHKTSRWAPAVLHAALYTVPFFWLRPSPPGVAIIFGSHLVIDRWNLARYIAWLSNRMMPAPRLAWAECRATGHSPERPLWLTFWLSVIVDNTLHVLINGWAMRL